MRDPLVARPQAFFLAGALGMSVALAAPFLAISPADPAHPAASSGVLLAAERAAGRLEPKALAQSPAPFDTVAEAPLTMAEPGHGAETERREDIVPAAPESVAASPVEPPAPEPQAPPPPVRDIAGRLTSGKTLAQVLGEQGVDAAAVNEIVTALAPHYDFRRAPAEATWEAHLAVDGGQVETFRFVPSRRETLQAVRGEDGRLTGSRHEAPLVVRAVRVEATIESSLYAAIEQAGESAALAALIADVFAWDLDFSRDQQPGDSFRMMVEKRSVDGVFLEYGRVLAAEYAGRKGTYRAFWYQPEDGSRGRYYLEDGRSAEKVFLATPVEFTRVSSQFKRNRKHPILGFTRAHDGTDFAAPRGTPVRAMADGVVTFAGRKGGSGKLVVIRHDNGLESYYAHLDRIAGDMKSGRRVRQKQAIGRVGSTGLATGPHLHLGVKRNGKWVDPQRLKITRSEPLPAEHRKAFGAVVADRMASLEAPAPVQARAALSPAVGRADGLGELAAD